MIVMELYKIGDDFVYQFAAQDGHSRSATIPRKFNKEMQEIMKKDFKIIQEKQKKLLYD